MATNFDKFLEEINRLGIEHLAEDALKNALESYKAKRAQEEEDKKNTLYLVRFDNKGKVRIRQVIKHHNNEGYPGEWFVTDLESNNQTYAYDTELRKTKTGALKLAVKLYQQEIKDLQTSVSILNKRIPELEALLAKVQKEVEQNNK